MPAAHDAIAQLVFGGTWRRYQQLALDAFEADRSAGHRHTRTSWRRRARARRWWAWRSSAG